MKGLSLSLLPEMLKQQTKPKEGPTALISFPPQNGHPLKEMKPVSPKGNQSWIFIGRTDAEAETPICWPPDAKNWLIGKESDSGEDWRQEEKGTTEDEMVRLHHWLNRHEFEQALGDGDGQGSLVCCSPWGCKESDTTERLNWTEGWGISTDVGVSPSWRRPEQKAPTVWWTVQLWGGEGEGQEWNGESVGSESDWRETAPLPHIRRPWHRFPRPWIKRLRNGDMELDIYICEVHGQAEGPKSLTATPFRDQCPGCAEICQGKPW